MQVDPVNVLDFDSSYHLNLFETLNDEGTHEVSTNPAFNVVSSSDINWRDLDYISDGFPDEGVQWPL